MSNLEEYSNKIHEEVTAVLSRVDPEQVQSALDLIQKARKIAFYGAGREGLMMRALAMRLFHLGYDVSVVGDMTTPFLTNGDLLILSVGSGYISTGDALRSVAQRDGATVLCLTAQPDGKTPAASDKIVYLPAQTSRRRRCRAGEWREAVTHCPSAFPRAGLRCRADPTQRCRLREESSLLATI